MRRLILILLIGFTALTAKAQVPSFHNAIEYNDYIVGKQSEIGELINGLMAVVDDTLSTVEQAQGRRQSAIIKMNVIIDDIRSMPDWKGNTELRDVSVELFTFYRSCFENEYKQMIDIIYNENATDTDYALLDTLLAQVTEKEKPLDAKFANAQESFAKANGFTLSPQSEEK